MLKYHSKKCNTSDTDVYFLLKSPPVNLLTLKTIKRDDITKQVDSINQLCQYISTSNLEAKHHDGEKGKNT